jgi:ParB/RepB/Spo0J family partition protein
MSNATRLEHIPLSLVRENSDALRTDVDKDSVSYKELVNSIRDEGVLLPILVREEVVEGHTTYPLVDGLQRFTAASEAGLETIPAQITTMAENKVLAAQVMANATRVETAPAQFAGALKRIFQLEPTLTKEELGRRVGKSGSWVEQQLKLTKLTPEIQKLVDGGNLVVGNASILASLPQDKQADYLQDAMTMPVATFGPKITEVLKEIRAAARQGRVVDHSFKAIAQPRKSTALRTLLEEVEAGNPVTIKGLLQANDVATPEDAAAFMVKYFFSLDPQSVALQRAKWETEQKGKEEAKKKREEERAAKKLDEAKTAAAKVTA